MRLLITRARDDAERTRLALEKRGHAVLLSPVIEIVAHEVLWPEGVIDGVVATSAHAFEATFHTPLPTRETCRLMPLFLVGSRTEQSARDHGFLGAAVVAPDSRALGAWLQAHGGAQRRLLFLAGRDRKASLGEHLPDLKVVETYEATPADAITATATAQIRLGHVDAVLHYSRRSAELFLVLAMKAALPYRTLRHICLSEDVAASLRSANCTEISTASEPTEQSMFDLLASP